jgi:hypothetical protein
LLPEETEDEIVSSGQHLVLLIVEDKPRIENINYGNGIH